MQAHAPTVPVIVRTIDDTDLERLQAAGATEVVPEAIEGSLMLASHALALVGVPMRRVIRLVQRAARRALRPAARLLPRRRRRHRRRAAAGAPAQRHPAARQRRVGRTLGELALHAVGVTWSRCGARRGAVAAARRRRSCSAAGDTLVLSGLPEPLALAEEALLGTPA